jgi:hypothetical protein
VLEPNGGTSKLPEETSDRVARSNPIRDYQDAEQLDLVELAERLGISLDYAKKLASGAIGSVDVARAWDFDCRTGGALKFDDVVAWGASNGHAPSAAVLARLARGREAAAEPGRRSAAAS